MSAPGRASGRLVVRGQGLGHGLPWRRRRRPCRWARPGRVTVMVQVPVSGEAKTSTTALSAPSPMAWRLSPQPSARRVATASWGAAGSGEGRAGRGEDGEEEGGPHGVSPFGRRGGGGSARSSLRPRGEEAVNGPRAQRGPSRRRLPGGPRLRGAGRRAIHGAMLLALGLLLFAAAHLWRRLAPASRLRAGPAGKGVVALASVAGVWLMARGYGAWDGAAPWWGRTAALTHANNLLVAVAFYLFVASGARTAAARAVRHPQLLAVILWACAHLLVNGDAPSLVLFGGLGLWALATLLLVARAPAAAHLPARRSCRPRPGAARRPRSSSRPPRSRARSGSTAGSAPGPWGKSHARLPLPHRRRHRRLLPQGDRGPCRGAGRSTARPSTPSTPRAASCAAARP
jgi:hypothetical protein